MKAKIQLSDMSVELLIAFLQWFRECPLKNYEILLEVDSIQKKDC